MTGSAECIDLTIKIFGDCVTGDMCRYRLSPGVRARKERFGLLFYNSGNARLTFVKSGESFDIVPDSECGFRLMVCSDNEGREQIERTLEALLRRGLIVETRPGI